jgi:uncharacterized spore protein YtfJ
MDDSIEDLIKSHQDSITVKKVFGEPFQKNGVTIIPAAKVMGGGGGGSGQSPETGEGSGTGFGMSAKPTGAYVIRGDEVKWEPAIDANRAIAGVLMVMALGLFLRFLRKR